MMQKQLLAVARQVTRIVPGVLQERGLDPQAIKVYILAETDHGMTWLFVVLDEAQLGRIENWTAEQTLHQISTALKGLPVEVSNSSGLRYAVLISRRRPMPRQIPFPGWRQGMVQIGINHRGMAVALSWPELRHVLVAGMSGYGKSTFLSLLVSQALAEGLKLAMVDVEGTEFLPLRGHSQLIAPIGETFDGAQAALDAVIAEMQRRKTLFENAPGFPKNLEAYRQASGESLERLLVVIDEYNGLVTATGGPKGRLAQQIAQVAWKGRKFGVHLVLAGQEFTKAVVGPAHDQLATRICFRVMTHTTSQVVLGSGKAANLKTPGRAWTPWGLVQVYEIEEDWLKSIETDGLTQAERDLAARLLEQYQGRMPETALVALGYSQRAARALRRDWQVRGLAEIRPDSDNALCLVAGRFVQPVGFVRSGEKQAPGKAGAQNECA